MAMLEDARAGKIDLIRVKTVSRFSRNSLDTIKITQELKEIGVEVYFDGQGISNMDERSELAISVLAAISQGEIIDISDNVIWGLARSREKGKIILPFSIFLGYKKGEDGRIEIDKKEARVVRKIYEMFNNEMSMRKIAHYLGCRVKYKTPGGKDKW